MRAEFAHPDDDKLRLDPGAVCVSMHRGPMDRLKVLIDDFIGCMDEDRGEIGQGAGRVFDRGQVQQVPHTDAQHFPAPHPSQDIQL